MLVKNVGNFFAGAKTINELSTMENHLKRQRTTTMKSLLLRMTTKKKNKRKRMRAERRTKESTHKVDKEYGSKKWKWNKTMRELEDEHVWKRKKSLDLIYDASGWWLK